MKSDRESIRTVATDAARASPASKELDGAATAVPVLVKAPSGNPEYWLVPSVRGDWACGFASVPPEGVVQRAGALGSGRADGGGWIPASYFTAPPPEAIREISERYPRATLADPVFSFDRSPARWGWRIHINPPAGVIVFVSPGGWTQVPDETMPDSEL